MPTPVGVQLPTPRWRRLVGVACTALWCCLLAVVTQYGAYHYFHRHDPERDHIVSRVDVSTIGAELVVRHAQPECEMEAWVWVGERRTGLGCSTEIGEIECHAHVYYSVVPELLDRLFKPGNGLEVRYRSFCGAWRSDKAVTFNRVVPPVKPPSGSWSLPGRGTCGKGPREA